MSDFETLLAVIFLLILAVTVLTKEIKPKPPTKLDEVVTHLKDYITIDREIRDNKVESDASEFQESHCKDIEYLINVVQRLKR